MRYMRFAGLLLLVALLLPAAAHGQSQIQLHWERYETVVDVNRDGSLLVQEQQVLVVDRGTLRRMTRTFATGDQGRVLGIRVLEDGQPYSRGSGTPGTYAGSDDGSDANIQLWFRDPAQSRHEFTIEYTVKNALALSGDRVLLDWNFFWSTPDAPEIRAGGVTINFPQQVNSSELQIQTDGVAVDESLSDNTLRWQLTEPIQGADLNIQAEFPSAILAPDAAFRSGSATGDPRSTGDSGFTPNSGTSSVPAIVGGGISLMFCIVVLVILFVVFMVVRSSARRVGRSYSPYDYGPRYGPSYGPGSFGGPLYRRRRSRGWGGGWGGSIFPPYIGPGPFGGNRDRSSGPFDGGPGGDSGGSGSNWGDSGGSGSNWGDSGGSGSNWGDSGGSGSSWGLFGGGRSSGGSRRSSGGGRRSGGGGRRSGGGGRGGGGFG